MLYFSYIVSIYKNLEMTLKFTKITALLIVMTFITSCSHRMVGTWNVSRFETSKPGEQSISLNNVGTMEFKGNGSGEKKLNYSVLGIDRNDELPFKWEWNDDKYISIESEGSEFSKTWIIIENNRKFQKWKSTDGTNTIQVLELKK